MFYESVINKINENKKILCKLFNDIINITDITFLQPICYEIKNILSDVKYNKHINEKECLNKKIMNISDNLEKTHIIGNLMLNFFNNLQLIDNRDTKIRDLDIIGYLNIILLNICKNRKIFINDENKDVLSAGVIFYKVESNKLKLLLIKKNHIYEDLGGKSDTSDESIKDIAIREVLEESNNILNLTKDRLNYSIYLNEAKYCLFLVEANENEKQLISEDFGEYEEISEIIPSPSRNSLNDPSDVLLEDFNIDLSNNSNKLNIRKKIRRKILWVEYENFSKVHYRLQNHIFTNELDKLQKSLIEIIK